MALMGSPPFKYLSPALSLPDLQAVRRRARESEVHSITLVGFILYPLLEVPRPSEGGPDFVSVTKNNEYRPFPWPLFLTFQPKGPIAQWLEQETHNLLVLRSSRSGPTHSGGPTDRKRKANVKKIIFWGDALLTGPAGYADLLGNHVFLHHPKADLSLSVVPATL